MRKASLFERVRNTCSRSVLRTDTLRRGWEAASGLGVEGNPPLEQRRVRLGNQSAVIGGTLYFAYAVGYAVVGPQRFAAPLGLNLTACLAMACCLLLAANRKTRIARVVLLTTLNVHIVTAALLLGKQVGYHYYLFLFAAAALLLVPFTNRWLVWLFPALSTLSFCYVQYGTSETDAVIPIASSTATVLHAGSTVLTVATLLLIMALFQGDALRAESLLEREHERSERLLLNVLPGPISLRLKSGEEPIADRLTEVTVLFTDLVGFTDLSARMRPDELVEVLNRIFSAFDALSERYRVEKIKTIGDAYMVAAGLPDPRPDHALIALDLAFDMLDALQRIRAETGLDLALRIGVHTGPVVAGVIGKRKFSYDLWGDTVNTASRMESHGQPGKIQITDATRRLVEHSFELVPRGMIAVKGKGDMETFFVVGRRKATARQAMDREGVPDGPLALARRSD